MKKFVAGFLVGTSLAIGFSAAAAQTLAQRLNGKILLAVEDQGKTWYVNGDGKRYRITQNTAFQIFKKLSLGITNNDLASIPEGNVGVDPETGAALTNTNASPSSDQTAPDQPATTGTPSSPPSAAPTVDTLIDVRGDGTKTTDTFTVTSAPWYLNWDYDCSNFGDQGNFQVDIYNEDGTPSDFAGVNELGAGSSDTETYHKPGTYYLVMNSECTWHVWANQ